MSLFDGYEVAPLSLRARAAIFAGCMALVALVVCVVVGAFTVAGWLL